MYLYINTTILSSARINVKFATHQTVIYLKRWKWS